MKTPIAKEPYLTFLEFIEDKMYQYIMCQLTVFSKFKIIIYINDSATYCLNHFSNVFCAFSMEVFR